MSQSSLNLRPSEKWGERLYFGLQFLRRGVDRSQVRVASQLLDGTADEIREHVTRRLKETHEPGKHDPLTWLDSQPLLVRGSLDDHTTTWPWYRRFRRFELKKTSGSTGQPVRLCKDMAMAARIDATLWALYGWHGITPGMRHARFWGLPPGRFNQIIRQLLDRTLQRKRFNAFRLTKGRVKDFFVDLLAFQPRYVHGYPSLVDEFVRMASEASLDGRDLGVKVVFLTGEMLRDSVRERVSSFFGARVVNEYGCSESGLLTFECESGRCHLIPFAAFPEVVDSANRRICDQGTGEVVVTDLFGTHLPLRRYRLGDRIVVKKRAGCECGRALPVVEISAGRVSSFITLPSGRQVFAAAIAYSMPSEVRRFQARQVALDRLEVDVELPPNQPADSILKTCHLTLHKVVNNEITVTVRSVHRIPQESGGKLRYLIPLTDSEARSCLDAPP